LAWLRFGIIFLTCTNGTPQIVDSARAARSLSVIRKTLVSRTQSMLGDMKNYAAEETPSPAGRLRPEAGRGLSTHGLLCDKPLIERDFCAWKDEASPVVAAGY
jgi:hypothetical protein